ncbi:hypothetical protein MRX96_006158 [Rhipicephalus microplus]
MKDGTRSAERIADECCTKPRCLPEKRSEGVLSRLSVPCISTVSSACPFLANGTRALPLITLTVPLSFEIYAGEMLFIMEEVNRQGRRSSSTFYLALFPL